MCEVEKVPNYFVRVRFEEQKKKKGVCVRRFLFFWKFFRLKGRGKSEKEGQKEGKERKGRRISLIKSWHHQDARDEHVRINDSFFLGRTRDDQHHPKAKERERERERESTTRAQIILQRESDVEHRGVDQKRLLLDALCFLERLFQ